MKAEDLEFHSEEAVEFMILPDGRIIFSWWNPLTQKFIEILDGVLIDPDSSNFCG